MLEIEESKVADVIWRWVQINRAKITTLATFFSLSLLKVMILKMLSFRISERELQNGPDSRPHPHHSHFPQISVKKGNFLKDNALHWMGLCKNWVGPSHSLTSAAQGFSISFAPSPWTQGINEHKVWMKTGYEWKQAMNEHRLWMNTGHEWTQGIDEHWRNIWEQQTSAGELWLPRNVTISAASPVSAPALVSCQNCEWLKRQVFDPKSC